MAQLILFYQAEFAAEKDPKSDQLRGEPRANFVTSVASVRVFAFLRLHPGRQFNGTSSRRLKLG
jgi:hypothetical protein